jgi:hypothetical protein
MIFDPFSNHVLESEGFEPKWSAEYKNPPIVRKASPL